MTTTRTDLQRLLAEEPFVRLLARSLVADEADDVVQQAFLQALEHRPGSLVQPRWWLARVVRNLVADHRRRSQRRDARQRAAAVPERVPSSSELLEGEERRRALVTAVDRLSPDQRTVVLLRYYEGLPPRRIAAELRLPVATVWNRLHAALQALRLRLDAEHGGDRRAWLLPLVPFATQPRALPWREVVGPSANPVLWTGVIAMTAKTKFAAAVAAVLVLAGAWAVWPSGGNPEPRLQDNTAQFEPLAAKAEPPAAQADAAPGGPAERAPVSLPEAATKGTLVVHVLHADEPKAAAGLTVSVGPLGDFRVGLQCGVTDATGTVSFSAVAPGKVVVSANRVPSGVLAEVRPGTASECTLQLELGMTVSGIVVDGGGVPIAGAQVEAGMAGVSGVDAMAVAVTAADGTFAVRGISTNCVISARVAGHAASLQQLLLGKRGGTEAVRIVLSAAGGSVAGVVVAADGSAVPGAVVRVGKGRTDCIHPTGWHAEPLPAQVRTDAEGRFLAIGVPVGEQLLMVRAATFAPWSGSCEVAAGLVVPVRVSLSAGVTCTGIVRTEDGVPARSVEVTSGNPGDFAQFRAYSGEDGAFTLTGLPVGDVELRAGKWQLGKATTLLRGEAGATVRCELVLSNGLALRGRVVDQTGASVGDLICTWEAVGVGTRWMKSVQADAQGRCLVTDCPEGRPFSVNIEGRGIVPMRRDGIDPHAGEIELRVERDLSPRAQIIGTIVGPDGRPVEGVAVTALRTSSDYRHESTATDGRFAMTVTTGTWRLWTDSKGHPTVALDAREVMGGSTWDVGTIQLPQGRRLVVRETGFDAGKLEHLIFDAREHFVCGLDMLESPPRSSELLAAGAYQLLVRGADTAAQALPFAIRSDQDTELEVRAAAGVRQRVEFVNATGAELPRSVAFAVRRDGRLVLWHSADGEGAGPLVRDIWLVPGSYTLATRDREPTSTAAFTMGSEAGQPVRVELR